MDPRPKTLQVAENAQPVADNAASKVEAAGHITAEKTVAAADAASEDIERMAHATGKAGVQATADVSKVIEDVAHDAEVRLLDSCILWVYDVDFVETHFQTLINPLETLNPQR